MIAFKLDKREDAVSQSEFDRSKRNLWMIAAVWMIALIGAVMTVGTEQWYYLAGVALIFVLTLPSPGELFQSFEGYKMKWLRHGGSSRGEKVAKINR